MIEKFSLLTRPILPIICPRKKLLFAVLSLSILLGSFSSGQSEELPSEITYLIFVKGQQSGKCKIRISEEGSTFISSCSTRVRFPDLFLNISTKTRIDGETWKPISFTYRREVGNDTLAGTIIIKGDSIIETGGYGRARLRSRKKNDPVPLVFLADYVVAHQIFLVRRFLAFGQDFKTIYLFFPLDFDIIRAVVSLESEIELKVQKGYDICKKIQVLLEGSLGYLLYVDNKSLIPIYLDFGVSATEIFLESYFGKNPRCKYAPSPE